MPKYIDVVLVTKNGLVARNPLKISESDNLITLAENNRSLVVKIKEVSEEEYVKIFKNG